MKIIDINGKQRDVISIKKVIHKIKNDETDEILEYIEILIKGKNRIWTEWYPLENFQKLNPELKVE